MDMSLHHLIRLIYNILFTGYLSLSGGTAALHEARRSLGLELVDPVTGRIYPSTGPFFPRPRTLSTTTDLAFHRVLAAITRNPIFTAMVVSAVSSASLHTISAPLGPHDVVS